METSRTTVQLMWQIMDWHRSQDFKVAIITKLPNNPFPTLSNLYCNYVFF